MKWKEKTKYWASFYGTSGSGDYYIFVFMSLRNSFKLKADETDISKIINKDTKELENVSKNLDKDIDAIFGREDFQQLYRHIDINMEFEVGKTDPFKSF